MTRLLSMFVHLLAVVEPALLALDLHYGAAAPTVSKAIASVAVAGLGSLACRAWRGHVRSLAQQPDPELPFGGLDAWKMASQCETRAGECR